jgi:hypothetical protein
MSAHAARRKFFEAVKLNPKNRASIQIVALKTAVLRAHVQSMYE